jgi:hypothetical protein
MGCIGRRVTAFWVEVGSRLGAFEVLDKVPDILEDSVDGTDRALSSLPGYVVRGKRVGALGSMPSHGELELIEDSACRFLGNRERSALLGRRQDRHEDCRGAQLQ